MEKTYDSIKLLGTLAVERGWVSNEDVQLALNKQKNGKFFGEILLSKNLITLAQLDELLKLQHESEVRTEDFLFGQIAVHNRFITAEEVILGIEEQKATKFRKSLGNILTEKGLINEQQCNAILASQKRIQKTVQIKVKIKKISCPKCQTFYQIKEAERFRKVRCKNCNFVFEVGSQDVKVSIEPIVPKNESEKRYEESKSLLQFLKENELTPQSNLSDSTNIIIKDNERYILGNEIARGGMGSIVLTKDVNLRRNIVTKVLLNKKSKLGTLRFIEEAQITGQLEHPNIPPVYDLGLNKDQNIFFTMKQIKGETLESIIKKCIENKDLVKERYSFNVLVNIFVKVCNALEFAHSKKVIHRDIKPENIMVGEYGEVLLMDWGLAKIIGTTEEFEELDEDRVSSVRSEDESSNTLEGTTAGTPAFMSPEQATGQMEELDQRSDIYSLGATLYSVLALERPVKGKNIQDILKNAANGNIQELNANIPLELKAITLKAMEFEQRHRYQTVKEMEKDLLNYQMGYSVSAKQDNALDIIKKFYKRNKLLTVVSASFIFVFVVGSIFFITSLQSQRNKSNEALVKAELAIKQFENEKLERITDNKNSAPTYYAKAQIEAQLDKFSEAEKLMDTAISYDTENQNYRLYRGCLALTNNEIAKAKADLAFVKNHPNQKSVQQIIDILNTPNLKAIDERQKPTLADLCNSLKLFDVSQKLTNDLAKKLEIWNKKLISTWGNSNFTLTNFNNKILFQKGSQNDNPDYSALKGIPIQVFKFYSCPKISNISFMENMPIEELTLYGSPLITDISSLKNIKLKYLYLEGVKVTDLSSLSNSELTFLALRAVPVKTLKPILHLPLKEVNFYDLKLDNVSELLSFHFEKVTFTYSQLNDLDFIHFNKLKAINFYSCGIKDISKFKNAPLEILELCNNPISDISSIQDKNITLLNLGYCPIKNFDVILTLKNLETLIITPNTLQPGWEQIILKMKNQIKKIGTNNSPDQLKSVDKFLEEQKGFNINNQKK
jgi:predicted Zn finger-like uncharacterized protein